MLYFIIGDGMKKNGFTLVELLGVVTILAMLGIIVIPVVTGLMSNSKQSLYDTQIRLIESGASNYIADNIFNIDLPIGTSKGITLGTLKSMGYIDSNIKDPISKKKFDDDMVIIVTNTSNGYEYKVCTQYISCDSVSMF